MNRIGAGGPGVQPVGLSVLHRLPWLIVNLGTVLLAAAVISVFETAISAAAMLAVFLPVVAGQGGIAGTQTVTLVTRGLAMALGLAMVGNLLVAALAGAGMPLILGKMRVDPAVFVTTFTDIFGFLIFLGAGAWFILWIG